MNYHSFARFQIFVNKTFKSQYCWLHSFSFPYILFIVLSLTFSSCVTEIFEDVSPQLEVTVVNTEGDKVEGANVKLYKSLETWEKAVETPVAEQLSNASGIALFTDMETEAYYILINKEKRNNKYGISQLLTPLKPNENHTISIIIK